MRAMIMMLSSVSIFMFACGGGGGKGGGDASAYDQLKGVPAELDSKLAALMQPIDGVDAIVAKITEAPAKFKLEPKDMSAALSSAIKGEVTVPGSMDEKGKAEFKGLMTEIADYKKNLYATPDNATALIQTCVEQSAKVPVLGTKAKTEAEVAANNPLNSKKEKEAAKAQSAGVDQLQADVLKSIDETKAKVMGVPGKAPAAISKFAKALTDLGVDMGAADATKGAVDKSVNDAKESTDAVK